MYIRSVNGQASFANLCIIAYSKHKIQRKLINCEERMAQANLTWYIPSLAIPALHAPKEHVQETTLLVKTSAFLMFQVEL